MNNLLNKVKELWGLVKELFNKTKPFFEKVNKFLSPVKAFYKKHFDIFNPIVVLTAICIIMAAALSLTNSLTAARIAEISLAKQESERQALLPAETYQHHNVSGFEDDVNFEFYSALNGSEKVGYIVTTSAKGYSGDIVVMTAFLPSGEIKSVSILNADNETPGLGQNITKPAFYSQFEGIADKATVVKTSPDKEKSEVAAVTGATISSKGATSAVNLAREALNAYLTTPGLEENAATPEGNVDNTPVDSLETVGGDASNEE